MSSHPNRSLTACRFSKNSPYIFNQAESKKTNKIIDSNSNIIEDDIQEDN